MSERYSRLFALTENLYATGSPVVIAAGALLKDNLTGKVLAQLKIRNIGTKSIKAAKVCIRPLDTVGRPLGAEIEYQYLDLSADRNGEFGAKSPISLSNAATRSFAASVVEAIFADNTIWKATDSPWETLSAPVTLDRALKDWELVKQYRIKFGADCKYEPNIQKDLWYCTCGELNRKEETVCQRCKKSVSSLLSLDLNALKQERDSRVAAEQQKVAEEKAAADAKTKKVKKLAMIITPIVVVLIVAAVLIPNIVKKNQEEAARREAYNAAVTLMDSMNYEEAIIAFNALDGYKDSTVKIAECETAILDGQYAAAEELMNAGQYFDAIITFKALDGYKDSAEKVAECEAAILDGQYADAVMMMESEQYAEAFLAFSDISNYKDSQSLSENCLTKYWEAILIGQWKRTGGWSNPYYHSYFDLKSLTWTEHFDSQTAHWVSDPKAVLLIDLKTIQIGNDVLIYDGTEFYFRDDKNDGWRDRLYKAD